MVACPDVDGDGFLSRDELKSMEWYDEYYDESVPIGECADDEWDDYVLDDFDTNADGKVVRFLTVF